MNKLFASLLIVILTIINTQAQDTGVSFELHYPISFEDDMNKYTDPSGTIGGAIQYRFTDNDMFNYGIEYKFDVFQVQKNLDGSSSDPFNYISNNINLFTKINFESIEQLEAYITAGFSVYDYSQSSTSSSGYTGFNAGVGLNYNIVERFYFFTNFNYLKAYLKYKQSDYTDTETRQILRFGIGFNL